MGSAVETDRAVSNTQSIDLALNIRLIQQKARQNKSSISKTIVGLLEGSVGMKRKKTLTRYQDLDALAGSWTAEEARTFEEALAMQREIDPDLMCMDGDS